MKRCPVHEIGGAFVGAKEEDLRLRIEVVNLLLDVGSLAGNKKIDDSVDVLLKRADVRSTERRQDGSFGAALRNVLVLEVLG